MQRTQLTAGLALLGLGLLAVLLWRAGAGGDLAQIAQGYQRDFQNAMARALRALRGGEPGALAALLGVCAAYGFLHAAGPGHGKAVIGAYGIAHRVGALRLSLVTIAAALAQATSALVLFLAGLFVFDLGRAALVETAEDTLARAGLAAIGLIGLWIAWRGWAQLRRVDGPSPVAAREDAPSPPAACAGGCGHAHGPDPAQLAAATGPREIAAIIATVALRPCTGALLLLFLTWRMDLFAAGIAGVYAMGLGTAGFTLAVAWSAVGLREGALSVIGSSRAARAGGMLALLAGTGLALLAGLALLDGGVRL